MLERTGNCKLNYKSTTKQPIVAINNATEI